MELANTFKQDRSSKSSSCKILSSINTVRSSVSEQSEQAYTPTFFFFLSIYCIFLFGTAAEIPIVERLVKVESEADLDQDSEAIGIMEFLQKGKYTEETQNFTARLLHLVVSSTE
jgi:hypothetical protein